MRERRIIFCESLVIEVFFKLCPSRLKNRLGLATGSEGFFFLTVYYQHPRVLER